MMNVVYLSVNMQAKYFYSEPQNATCSHFCTDIAGARAPLGGWAAGGAGDKGTRTTWLAARKKARVGEAGSETSSQVKICWEIRSGGDVREDVAF